MNIQKDLKILLILMLNSSNSKLKKLVPKNNIKPKKESITCVYFSNADTITRHPLTPWIIAHRFGHALY